MGPIVLGAFFILYGLAYVVFAFHKPPAMLETFFRVPAIFPVVLGERRVLYGRLAVGILFVLAPFIVYAAIVLRTP
jgi:hypothetical protein